MNDLTQQLLDIQQWQRDECIAARFKLRGKIPTGDNLKLLGAIRSRLEELDKQALDRHGVENA